jgi:predicted RNA binding protein YcfA (HicA-like mRNA interferase family)
LESEGGAFLVEAVALRAGVLKVAVQLCQVVGHAPNILDVRAYAKYIWAMSMKKEIKALRKEAEAQGWRVELRKGGHLAFYSPHGKGIVFAPSTPSDRRSINNVIADLRKYGFVWKGH